MTYIDCFVAAVPNENKAKYLEHAKLSAQIFKEHGALEIRESWGDDVPDGKVTSLPMAVKCEENENVVFSTVVWLSKEARNQGWEKIMQDPRMDEKENPMPFDGKRLIFGGFDVILQQ